MPRWLSGLFRGAGYITLDPSPRLRKMREQAGRDAPARLMPLPPLPDSAYPPGAVPLDASGVPGSAGDPLAARDSGS
jgi:hypothetical protein